MNHPPVSPESHCESFLEQLDLLPLQALDLTLATDDWRALLPEAAREHLAACSSCQAALADFVETRAAFGAMRATMPQPGPWFVSRVMATIRAQQNAIEEQAENVWASVMRLAPRLSALAAIILVLGGTWLMELRRAEQSRHQQSAPAEGLFESSPAAPNDDIIASYEEYRP